MKEAGNIALGMVLAILLCAVGYLGTTEYKRWSAEPVIATADPAIERELARLRESIRQMKVVKEEAFLRRDIMQAQQDIRELAATLPKVAPTKPD